MSIDPFRRQLELLGYKDEDVVYLRGFHPANSPIKDGGRKKHFKFRRGDDIARTIACWEAEGRGCYFVVNGQGQTAGCVEWARALFYEHDDVSCDYSREIWRELGLPQPSFQILTGGKSCHSYWALADRPAITDWSETMQDLIFLAQSDPSIKDASRVMRCAGSRHPGTGRIAELFEPEDAEKPFFYPFAELRAKIPDSKFVIASAQELARPDDELTEKLIEDALNAIPPRKAGENSYQLYRGLIRGLKAHYGEDSAIALMEAHSPSAECGWDVAQVAGSSHKADSIGLFFHCAKELGWIFPDWGKIAPTGQNLQPSESRPEVEEEPYALTKEGAKKEEKRCKPVIYRELIEKHLKNRLRWNEFTGACELDGVPLADYAGVLIDLSCQENFNVYGSLAEAVIEQVAKKHRYHPIQDYLNGVHGRHSPVDEGIFWQLVQECLLLEAHGDRLSLYCEFFKRTLIGAVERAFNPGGKFDTCMVLQGVQGGGKSTFWAKLCGEEWFRDSVISLTSKDIYQLLGCAWFLELAEIERFTNKSKDPEVLKQLLSSATDTYRAPYARVTASHPRRCVIVGSANNEHFLSDATGNRRIWVVAGVDAIDLGWIDAHRDFLWAWAVQAYRAGESSVLPAEYRLLAHEQAQDALEQDPWEDLIGEHLDQLIREGPRAGDPVHTTTAKILRDVINVHASLQTSAAGRRVAAILKGRGWALTRLRISGKRPRVYVPLPSGPDPDPLPPCGPPCGPPENLSPQGFQRADPHGSAWSLPLTSNLVLGGGGGGGSGERNDHPPSDRAEKLPPKWGVYAVHADPPLNPLPDKGSSLDRLDPPCGSSPDPDPHGLAEGTQVFIPEMQVKGIVQARCSDLEGAWTVRLEDNRALDFFTNELEVLSGDA